MRLVRSKVKLKDQIAQGQIFAKVAKSIDRAVIVKARRHPWRRVESLLFFIFFFHHETVDLKVTDGSLPIREG